MSPMSAAQIAAARAAGPPPCLPGFEHVNRYFDAQREMYAAKILPGEYYVTTGDELVATVLGSCVSACLRDTVTGVGGMNHFMLPDQSPGRNDPWAETGVSAATRYGIHAMEHLINDVLKHGGRRDRLEIKVVGGGKVLASMTNIGARNIAFVRSYLKAEGLRVVGEDLGDNYPRKVVYQPKTGRAWVRKLRDLHNSTLIERETSYRKSLGQQAVASGGVELF